MFSLPELEAAAALVHRHMTPTAQLNWPTLSARSGATIWVKHENHAPTGAFKVRGGITFIDWLQRKHPDARGIITATRGNHGQSQARAARAAGLRAMIYVPQGNAIEKNAAMRAFGAELVEFGNDYDAAREEALRMAEHEGLFFVPPYHTELVRGVATYALEFLKACPDLQTIYVPIGCGSGIAGVISARDALGHPAEVVGVVSENAQTAKLSAEAGLPIATETAHTFADGIAVRVPVPEALAVYGPGAARIISVSDDEVAEAIRIYVKDTHNLAEGAGAAPLAALMSERERMAGKTIGLILCGGNLDSDWLIEVLRGRTPTSL
ncbi:threonine dehydratase [Ovoidimarina sediminis]|uniref:threonine dehydratase n=1 Tax=Ovoidimarina sediminis TaxID=3079856 RepID=UPI0029138147|nr:threonine dehydratase [Rhodophyticola sp. MJ-SS7]MDU8944727.1 threonine dehydratase [Rhodophyticola sp. MJ-SS7]